MTLRHLIPWSFAAVAVLAGSQTAPAFGQEPTFAKDVAPIIFESCTSCHRPGEVGPFPLMNYNDVRKRAKMIQRVVERGIMPPWHPVEGHGEFEGELALTSRQIDIISEWVEADMPEGDRKKTPKLPKFTRGWQLGKPDMIVEMKKGYQVPAGGPDIYRNFVIELDLPEDKWLTAIEVRPGAPTVLHHILFSIDQSGEALKADGASGTPGFSGMRGGGSSQILGASTSGLGGWAVGGMPRHLPMGLARNLPKGGDLVLQSHFHPTGKA